MSRSSVSYRTPRFGRKKKASTKNALCHAHIPNFIEGFCNLGIRPNPENLGQIHKADLLLERVEIWGLKFQRAQKRKLGPKKKNLMGGGDHIGEIYPKKNFQAQAAPGFLKHWYETIDVFFLSY